MILPPPVTSDCTLDDVEAYLDRVQFERAAPPAWLRLERRLRFGLQRAKREGTQAGAESAGDDGDQQ